ncbi:hypothetical protein [Streptomyces misionensis]|uniref:hypothetical protein n=1 Tax=Streptomyces misionensis TaxID=67331 RepID=UPI0036AEB69F
MTGVLSILVGGVVSVAVAWISRPRARKPDEEVEAEPRQDLTTIAGIASVVAQQGERVRQQEARITELEAGRAHDSQVIAALRRYVLALRSALQDAGAETPEPAPADAHLIGQ